MNLDPTICDGGDPVTAVHKLGADRIYHVHAKDVRLERNYVGPDGVLDTKTIDQFAKRTWNYVALGHGHDVSWWKEFLSCLSMEGYDGPISQEMEDLTMPALAGLKNPPLYKGSNALLTFGAVYKKKKRDPRKNERKERL